MPRLPRHKSKSGIYHVMLRGTNKQEIFHDDEDKLKFLETLSKYKKTTKIELYAWCLMNNHLHLIIKEGEEDLGVTMKRISVSFAWYYNQKYRTTGHLFQDRYRSENIENDGYLVTVVRYIHQNPVKAGISDKPSTWKWSSCSGYYGTDTYPPDILNKDVLLKIFSEDRINAIRMFKEFNEVVTDDNCLDDRFTIKLTDEEAKAEMKKLITEINFMEIRSLPKDKRDEKLRKIKQIEGLSQRQIARILGLSQTLISNA